MGKILVAGNHPLVKEAFETIYARDTGRIRFGYANVDPCSLRPAILRGEDPDRIVRRLAMARVEEVRKHQNRLFTPMICGINIIPEFTGGGILFGSAESEQDVTETLLGISGKKCRIFIGISVLVDGKSKEDSLVLESEFRRFGEYDIAMFLDKDLAEEERKIYGRGYNVYAVRLSSLLPEAFRVDIETEIVFGLADKIFPFVQERLAG